MAARTRQGFVANRAGIGRMLKEDTGIQAALDALAEPMAEKAGGDVEAYTTDRAVRTVVVTAESQAKDGAATKAAGAMGLSLS